MKIDPLILFLFVAANGAAAFFLMASKLLEMFERGWEAGETAADVAPDELERTQPSAAIESLFETQEPEPEPARGEEHLARSLERWREESRSESGETLPGAAESCRTEHVA